MDYVFKIFTFRKTVLSRLHPVKETVLSRLHPVKGTVLSRLHPVKGTVLSWLHPVKGTVQLTQPFISPEVRITKIHKFHQTCFESLNEKHGVLNVAVLER